MRSRGRKEALREGVIRHHGRFAFLLAESPDQSDVFLHGRGLALAMDGDRVEARVRPEENGRFAGEVVRVITRARTDIVGILKQFPRGWAVFPEKGDAPPAQVVGFAARITPQAGALAVLKVTRWPTETAGAAGTVVELLGDPGDVRARLSAVLRARAIGEVFPKEALAQAGACGDRLEPAHWRGREELFDLPVITIDGVDAKDFDDAVSLEPLPHGGARLGVHIADVASYVKPGSALDKEAYARGTSVYLPGRVVPMLPPALSDNLCSLVPRQERLTVSVFMDISPDGKVTRRRLANTVIRSWRRFTYEEVQSLLDGKHVAAVIPAVGELVARLGDLTDVLYRGRVRRGALDFDLPEYKVETDAHGMPLCVSLRPRLKSHRLIEECMLLANEAVATELMAARIPFLHRRHDNPAPEKIAALAAALGELGIAAGHLAGGNIPAAIQDILRQAEQHPLSHIINALIVRSMKQAVYAPESLGHFGIAARAYAHFTSPIRRYPDLVTHRAVKAHIAGNRDYHGSRALAAAGVHCSERERAAVDAERKAVDILRAELLQKHIGAEMEGMVTTVIDRGSFVLCGDTGAEGLVRGVPLKPGAKVRVIVDAVDAVDGKIDLSLAGRPPLPAQVRVTRHPRRADRQ